MSPSWKAPDEDATPPAVTSVTVRWPAREGASARPRGEPAGLTISTSNRRHSVHATSPPPLAAAAAGGSPGGNAPGVRGARAPPPAAIRADALPAVGLAEGSDAGAEGRHRAGTMISIWEPAFGGTLTKKRSPWDFKSQRDDETQS